MYTRPTRTLRLRTAAAFIKQRRTGWGAAVAGGGAGAAASSRAGRVPMVAWSMAGMAGMGALWPHDRTQWPYFCKAR
jgi:hypothetical protein